MTPQEEVALRALKGARLMLYAWKGTRQNMGLPDDHRELSDTIKEVEEAIRRLEMEG